MKSQWLSAAFVAVALAVSACGGAEETLEPAQVSEPGSHESRDGDVEEMLLPCDEEGQCPTGYYCDPGWVCRRGVGAALSGAPVSSMSGGTCQENCSMDCYERYPNDSNMWSLCTYSCISFECGGGPFP
ncbi:hypothetical protein [Archangium lansingense]|uniref:Lipoprotein n=1 Tax=Archangium lansingense TaxID=2995310 RepID=A0ABT4AI59_9BACT|nr:hypothetical protein [Archangium lansinium]MCY1081310.1 hypothetical protein [Archangium lansinium]